MKRYLASLLLTYFRLLAQLQLKKVYPTIIGITGSAGKTSALQACEAILTGHFTLKVSHKANSESGIPLNILGLHPTGFSPVEWLRLAIMAPIQLLTNWLTYDIYLTELGVDSPYEPKNMSYLLKIIQPRVGIFLNALPVHSEAFDAELTKTDPKLRKAQLSQLIAQEKGKLIASLPKHGVAILNADDPLVLQFKEKTAAKVLTFGKQNHPDIKITEYLVNSQGTSFGFSYNQTSETVHLSGFLLPESYGYTFGAAIGCGISQGIGLPECCHQLEKHFKLPPGRATLIAGINQSKIIDSSYNASPQPVLDMLQLLAKTPAKRKLAVLGDMRELGSISQEEHQKIAKTAAAKADQVILVGPLMKKFALPIVASTKAPVKWFASADAAARHLRSELQPDDLVLIKGSQNTLLLEIAVEALMANPEKADELLCRRGKYWNSQRQKLKS